MFAFEIIENGIVINLDGKKYAMTWGEVQSYILHHTKQRVKQNGA